MEGHQLGLLFSVWLIPLRINLSLVVVVLTPQFISVSNWLKNLKQSKFLTSIFLIINFRSFAFTKVSVNPLSLFSLLFYSNVFWKFNIHCFNDFFFIESFFFVISTSTFSCFFYFIFSFLQFFRFVLKLSYWHIILLYFSFMFPWPFFNMFYAVIFF